MEQKTLTDALKILLAQKAKIALVKYIESLTSTPAGKYLDIHTGSIDTDTMTIEFHYEYVDVAPTDNDEEC